MFFFFSTYKSRIMFCILQQQIYHIYVFTEIHKFNKNKRTQDNDGATDDDNMKGNGKRLKKQRKSKVKRRNQSSVEEASDSTDSEEKSKKSNLFFY